LFRSRAFSLVLIRLSWDLMLATRMPLSLVLGLHRAVIGSAGQGSFPPRRNAARYDETG
jgi:hypothetical protein